MNRVFDSREMAKRIANMDDPIMRKSALQQVPVAQRREVDTLVEILFRRRLAGLAPGVRRAD